MAEISWHNEGQFCHHGLSNWVTSEGGCSVKVLVIGNGGREHALAWKLLQSPRVQEVVCVPGNGGTAALPRCRNLALTMKDFEGVGRFCLVNNIGLVVVGPEVPLAEGIVDYLQAQGLTVFGPTQAGAQIEASKSWAKALMQAAGIPTAGALVFTDIAAAIAHIETCAIPVVVKVDGLAAGKGVTVASSREEAKLAITAAFSGQFGGAGKTILIEEYLAGKEVSVLAVTDGQTIRPLLPAQDHKRIGEGDSGANTGGMGAYAPTPLVSSELMQRIQWDILEPTLVALQKQGIDYRGVLYAGLMVTPDGAPNVIEFNCRFGDPETQVVLPLLETPLDTILLACTQQRLEHLPAFTWKSAAAVCVVVSAEGYPGQYQKGCPIHGIEQAEATGALVFHAGTKLKQNQLLTDGGRVLGVTAIAPSFSEAIAHAYTALDCVYFDAMYYRRDIGYQVLGL